MKPRIIKRRGVWTCSLNHHRYVNRMVIGHGYTPLDAYRDWRAAMIRALAGPWPWAGMEQMGT
jgi:hypothetical protein